MRCLLPAVIAALVVPASAWEVSGSRELGTLPSGAGIRETTFAGGGTSARATSLVFSNKSWALRVVDSPQPGEATLAGALAQAGCVAGVNGSYFHPDFRPVGLAISDGRLVNGFERAKLLSGVLAVRGGRIEIVRSSKFQNSPEVRQAVQAGPVLVEDGAPTSGLNSERPARRTVVATDGRGQWALVYMTAVTLSDAAEILSTPGAIAEWKVATALNLDGGSSSGLWADASPAPVSRPELARVRNFIGIAPKP